MDGINSLLFRCATVFKRSTHTVATPRWLSHADARTRLNNNSGISCWWQASRPTRTALNNVRLDVLFKTDEPVSMQVSAQLSIASARHEFGHVFLDTGDSVLEQLPDTFNYIIWQSTQPQHQGGGLTRYFWQANRDPTTVIMPTGRRPEALKQWLQSHHRQVQSIRGYTLAYGGELTIDLFVVGQSLNTL